MNLELYLKELEEIVNMDSGSEDLAGCRKVAEYFAARFEEAGFDVRISREPGKHPHVEARSFVRKSDEIDILFMGHMDTVFPKGTVRERPFHIEDGKAWGPGAADMKSGGLLAFYLAKAVKDSALPLNLCIAFNSDEEVGSADSAEWIKELGTKARYCFNFEPGRDTGAFVKERKGVYDYQVTFKGIPAHAGVAPEKGASAVIEMARWIWALTNLNAPEQGTTLNPGLVKGGSASNVVAEHAELIIDLRYTQENERKRIERAFDEMTAYPRVTGVKVSWEKGEGFPPMTPGDRTEAMMELMRAAASELGQAPPEFASTGGGSDANNLGGLSVSVMDGCGPIGANYHSDREYMVISSVLQRYQLLLATIKGIAEHLDRKS